MRILMVIVLKLWTAFGRMDIFTLLILSIHDRGRSFYLLVSSSISLLVFWSFLYTSGNSGRAWGGECYTGNSVFCTSRAASCTEELTASVTACTRNVRAQARPILSTERGTGHKVPCLAKKLLAIVICFGAAHLQWDFSGKFPPCIWLASVITRF